MMSMNVASGVRIAGAGGAGMFMNSLALPAAGGGLRLGIDVSILSPDRLVTYLARGVAGDFPERVGRFLRDVSVADDGDAPRPFEETEAGLLITVTPIDGMWTEMEVRIAENLDDDVVEFDGINFETSRASLLIAAEAAEALGEVVSGSTGGR